MPDLTHPPMQPAALPSAVTGPSYAAQILTVAAWVLELDSTGAMTQPGLEDALTTAAAGVVSHLPAVVAETATLRARTQLTPYTGISHGEYALRLRAVARGV